MQASGKTQDDLRALMNTWTMMRDTTTHIYWSCGWLCPKKKMEYWITASEAKEFCFHVFLKYHDTERFVLVDIAKTNVYDELVTYLKQYYPAVYTRYIAETV